MTFSKDLWNKLETQMHNRKREIINFLQESIRTPSVSGQEGDYAELIAEKMRALGYDQVEIDGAGNVIGVVKGDDIRLQGCTPPLHQCFLKILMLFEIKAQ